MNQPLAHSSRELLVCGTHKVMFVTSTKMYVKHNLCQCKGKRTSPFTPNWNVDISFSEQDNFFHITRIIREVNFLNEM